MIATTDLMNFLMKSTSTYTRTDKTTAMVRIKTSSFILLKKSGFRCGLIRAICPRLHGTNDDSNGSPDLLLSTLLTMWKEIS